MAIGALLLEESSAAPLNQICVQTLIGVIHARRGEPEVWRALDSAIANAAPTGQPQYVSTGPARPDRGIPDRRPS